jgi:hypothetical protein
MSADFQSGSRRVNGVFSGDSRLATILFVESVGHSQPGQHEFMKELAAPYHLFAVRGNPIAVTQDGLIQ